MKPKPITATGFGSRIKIIFRDGGYPYMHVETTDGQAYGFIQDRDVKRLAAWCKRCMKKKGNRK